MLVALMNRCGGHRESAEPRARSIDPEAVEEAMSPRAVERCLRAAGNAAGIDRARRFAIGSRDPSNGRLTVPLYMDIHTVEGGVSGSDVAEAHMKDLQEQAKHGVDYKSYWVDEQAGKIFCLVEAPDAEAAHAVHREAHGLVADEIYEVKEGE